MAKILSLLIPFVACLSAPGGCFGQIAGWYRSYDGIIDKYVITMHLHKTGHKYAGYYYYNSKEEPIYFIGEDTSIAGGKTRLSAFIPDKEADESFIFSISGKVLTGEWNSGKGKPLGFSANESNPALALDYVYTEGTVPLRPKMKDSPAASFEAASIWPKGNSPQATFLKKIIREEFGAKNSTEDIGKIFLREKKQFFADYINDNKEMKDEDLKDAYSFNIDETKKLMIVYQTSKLLVLAHSSYAYTGGAHGNYGTSYFPVDLLKNKRLELNNVIRSPGRDQLPKLLGKYFRRAYSLKETAPLSEGGLFEDTIEPNDNFYVTPAGIGFCYTPYEIGPYAMGEINIFIPFIELSAYLEPGFKKLIQ